MYRVSMLLRPRWLAALSYIAYGGAGVAFLFFPSDGLKDLLGESGIYIWNGLLFLGGLISFIGTALRQYWLEFIGLPGVITGLLVLGLFVYSTALSTDQPGVIFGLGSVIIGAAIGSIGRAYEVRHILKVVTRVSRDIKDAERGITND